MTSSLLIMTLLGAAGWYGSGRFFAAQARQDTADHWNGLRRCLLGDGLRGHELPSARLRRIELASFAQEKSTWPAQCKSVATALDSVIKTRSVQKLVGTLPRAADIVADVTGGGTDLDALYTELERANLPLPRVHDTTPLAPAPALFALPREQLRSLLKARNISDVDVAVGPSPLRETRLLLAQGEPELCRLAGGPPASRWTKLNCRTIAISGMGGGGARLARLQPGAVDLIQVRQSKNADGFYDTSSGQRLWQQRYFDAQAIARNSGAISVFYAELDGPSATSPVAHYRFAALVPGKRPKSRRAKISRRARALLLPEWLLSWQQDPTQEPPITRDRLQARPLDHAEGKLGKPLSLGTLPLGARHLGECSTAKQRAMLFVSGVQQRHHMLLLQDGEQGFQPLLDLGLISDEVQLSCQPNAVHLTRLLGKQATQWTCQNNACTSADTQALPAVAGQLAAITSLGDKLALAWRTPGGPLMLRVGTAKALHQAKDAILVDDLAHGGLQLEQLRFISSDGVAVLLMRDHLEELYALRIDGQGKVSPLTIER